MKEALVVIASSPEFTLPKEQQEKWGEIVYIPLPTIPEEYSPEEIHFLIWDFLHYYLETLIKYTNVYVQGELSFATVDFICTVREMKYPIEFWFPVTETGEEGTIFKDWRMVW